MNFKLFQFLQILSLLIIAELVSCKTTTHYKTFIDSNGNRKTETWTTLEENDNTAPSSKPNVEFAEHSNIQKTYVVEPQASSLVKNQQIMQEEFMKKAAIESGMDPTAVATLLETKEPVIMSTTDANGEQRVTTYKLTPDGTISRNTIINYKPVLKTVSTGSVTLNELKKNDGNIEGIGKVPVQEIIQSNGPVTKTYVKDGEMVETSFDMPNRKLFNAAKPHNDWEWNSPYPQFMPSRPAVWTSVDTNPVELPASWNPNDWFTNRRTSFDTNIGTSSTKPRHDIETTTPLPSLEEFLKNQYNGNNRREPTTIRTIPIDDLPAGNIPLKPTLSTETVKSVHTENIPVSQTVENNVKSITQNVHSNDVPALSDLSPEMQAILRRAGIDPAAAPNDVGETSTITKTRTEPDGRVVTTTYKVRKVPNAASGNDQSYLYRPSAFDNPTADNTNHFSHSQPTFGENPYYHSQQPFFENHFSHSQQGANFPSFRPYNPEFNPNVPSLIPQQPSADPISAFLAKVGLTTQNIDDKNGELIKTIVDEKGRVLTVSFVLSSVRGIVDEKEKVKAAENKSPLK